MIGFKTMRFDPRTREIVSLADSRQRWSLAIGSIVRPRAPGLFLSPDRQYVLDYYASGGDADEVLLTFEFDPADITRGDLRDREPEIAVRQARLIRAEMLAQPERSESQARRKP